MKILKWLWELPQNALGYLFLVVTGAERYIGYSHKGVNATVYAWEYDSGLSLGKYIFVPYSVDTKLSNEVMDYIRHEHGHSIQSRYLGWAYLIVIGLPSLIWAGCFEGYRTKHNVSYYSFYTEKWADKLGGVTER